MCLPSMFEYNNNNNRKPLIKIKKREKYEKTRCEINGERERDRIGRRQVRGRTLTG